jgi:DNA-binding NarL/FixJ family response regulator
LHEVPTCGSAIKPAAANAEQHRIASRLILAVAHDGKDDKLWMRAIANAGHRVEATAADLGAVFVADGAGSAIDVIVFDSSVPDAQAQLIAQGLRRLPLNGHIPVIKLADDPDEAQVIAGLRAGIWYYLAVPCSPALMLAAIESAAADRERYRRMSAKENQAADTLRGLSEGKFRFRTLDDIERLARLIANACPEPQRVLIGLAELLLNAVEHGNLGISYLEKTRCIAKGTWLEEISRRLAEPWQQQRYATLSFTRGEHSATIRIEDCGSGFDWKAFLDVDSTRAFDAHGRGIAIARALSFDRIEFLGCGNIVTATVREAPHTRT